MKLIMAVSADGYVARKKDDDMSWLGAADKAAFRILTASGGGVVGVSHKTAVLMPDQLAGRSIVKLSRKDYSLDDFRYESPDSWLAGGQELALQAFSHGYLTEVHLCRSDRNAMPEDSAIEDRITLYLLTHSWSVSVKTRINDTVVECWRK